MVKYQVGRLLSSLRHRRLQGALFSFAELRGGIQGLFGEYERSERRSQRIRDTNAEAGAAHSPESP